MNGPNIVPLLLCTQNLPLSIHFYSTVFGFASPGERMVCSRRNGEELAHGLDLSFGSSPAPPPW